MRLDFSFKSRFWLSQFESHELMADLYLVSDDGQDQLCSESAH